LGWGLRLFACCTPNPNPARAPTPRAPTPPAPRAGWIGARESSVGGAPLAAATLSSAGPLGVPTGPAAGGRAARVQLWPGRAGGGAARSTAYRVVVRTGDMRDGPAGPDGEAGVVVTLYGTGAAAPAEGGVRTVNSGPLRLDHRGAVGGSAGGADAGGAGGGGFFAPGGVDAFTFTARDLGLLTSATVRGAALDGGGLLIGGQEALGPTGRLAAGTLPTLCPTRPHTPPLKTQLTLEGAAPPALSRPSTPPPGPRRWYLDTIEVIDLAR
jgi:hypothetical protein